MCHNLHVYYWTLRWFKIVHPVCAMSRWLCALNPSSAWILSKTITSGLGGGNPHFIVFIMTLSPTFVTELDIMLRRMLGLLPQTARCAWGPAVLETTLGQGSYLGARCMGHSNSSFRWCTGRVSLFNFPRQQEASGAESGEDQGWGTLIWVLYMLSRTKECSACVLHGTWHSVILRIGA